ncbi:MAG: hypothetical protein A2340_13215 [Lentisphaerae bacterium RIFOXYB12_FULL_60_10]|nr:MAG: hypothetical protein A2340_13215 [Lentisphaerae bacterium RIFOXYB12_FULL_60_10]
MCKMKGWSMEPKAYNELWMHREMLRDQIRCNAYKEAILKTVRPGHAVLDVGTGSGILAMFSALAGARKVYAVERTAVTEVTRELIDANGMGDRIEIIQSDIEAAQLPEKVDVITAEWMGGFGVDENLFHPVLQARDRWLKPGGCMIPGAVTALLAPAHDESVDQSLAFWRSTPYGLNLGPIAARTANEVHNAMHHVTGNLLLAEPQQLWHSDANRDTLESAAGPWIADQVFTANRAGTVSAVTAWFESELVPGVRLTNAPDAPKTHWGRTVMPLNQPLKVVVGTKVQVRFACHNNGRNLCHNAWSIKVGDQPWQHHAGRQGCTASPGFH